MAAASVGVERSAQTLLLRLQLATLRWALMQKSSRRLRRLLRFEAYLDRTLGNRTWTIANRTWTIAAIKE